MAYVQVQIKVDDKLYPEEANLLLRLRKERKVQKAFRDFLRDYKEREKREQLSLGFGK